MRVCHYLHVYSAILSRLFLCLVMGLLAACEQPSKDTSPSEGDSENPIKLSIARRFVMSTMVGDEIILAGGHGSSNFVATVDIIDIATGQMRTDSLSKRRGRGVAVTFGNKSYFAGGEECDDLANCTISSLVEIYNSTSKSWSSTNLSVARADMAGAATTDGYVVFAGGYTASSISNVVDIFNTNTNSWTTSTLSIPRHALSAVAYGNKIYFAGGRIALNGVTKSTLIDVFEPSTGTWTTKNLSVARSDFPSVVVGTKIFFAGGALDCSPCTTSDVVDIYDTSNDSWNTASLSTSRAWHQGISNGTIAVFSGGEVCTTYCLLTNTVDIYDSSSGQWTTATLSTPKGYHSSFQTGPKGGFVGGLSSSSTFTDTIDIFEFSSKTFVDSLN